MKKVRIGITGDSLYEDRHKIKEFIFNLKNKITDEIEIVSLGELNGADKHIKKYSLELGYHYKEFNLPHTQKNLYSLMPETYYGKPYMKRNVFQRDKIFATYVDMCIVFDKSNPVGIKATNIIKEFKKLKKNLVVIA
jgi:hypothetical protein